MERLLCVLQSIAEKQRLTNTRKREEMFACYQGVNYKELYLFEYLLKNTIRCTFYIYDTYQVEISWKTSLT